LCKILHIETSTDNCSVALSEGNCLIALSEKNQRGSHSSVLTVQIRDILSENNVSLKDLKAISVSIGPGSYTGLRIGLSTAKGLCYAFDIPLITVNTLISLSEGIKNFIGPDLIDSTRIMPMIDARRMEVYTAVFNKNSKLSKEPFSLIISQNWLSSLDREYTWYFGGTGIYKLRTLKTNKNHILTPILSCSAANQVPLAWNYYKSGCFADLISSEPFYLKGVYIHGKEY